MDNNNKVKLPKHTFFSIRKTKAKDANTIHISGTNSSASEKNDDKHLFEDEKCSISAHNRTHRLFRSIKDKFKKNKFTICKVKQKVTSSENKSNHSIFDETQSGQDCKELNNLPDYAPPLVPPRQNVSSDEVYMNQNFLRDSQSCQSNHNGVSSTSCSYGAHNASIQNNRHSGIDHSTQAAQDKNTYVDIIDLDSSSNYDNEYLHNPSFSKDFSNLTKCGYYWGPITRREAEEKLNNQPDGTFLIRDSASENHLFSLSFRSWGKTLHTRIEHSGGIYSICDQGGFVTIVELIDRTMHISKNGIYCYSRSRTPTDPAYPVRLTLPLSRFTRIRSLRHLCRFVIRQHINKNDIDKLKLPETIKHYLEEGYF